MRKFCRLWNKVPETYKGIVLFILCLLGSHFFWELTIVGDESDDGIVSFCGLDISWLFSDAVFLFAAEVHRLLAFFDVPTQLIMNYVGYSNGHGCNIIAGCTAIKQFFMMTVILLFSRGKIVHKSWYWLLSMIILVEYNIVRLTLLTYIVRDHAEWFDFMHGYVMKYVFYGFMFVLWLVWDEWLRKIVDKRKAD